jgi:predicted nucleic acid-binding protein
MIVLDTNVISEAMKPTPDAAVRTWLNAQAAETLYLSSITLAELLFGVEALPEGRRKAAVAQVVHGMIQLFRERVLPFDAEAAHQYARLAALAKRAGKGFPAQDAYIAAIAASRGFIVASGDISPFEAANVPVVNPWTG